MCRKLSFFRCCIALHCRMRCTPRGGGSVLLMSECTREMPRQHADAGSKQISIARGGAVERGKDASMCFHAAVSSASEYMQRLHRANIKGLRLSRKCMIDWTSPRAS